MAKRKLATRSGRAARAPEAPSGPRSGQAAARRAGSAGKAAVGGSRKQTAAGSRRKAKSPVRKAKAPAARAPQSATGRGAAQPGGRRTVEVFAHAEVPDGGSPTLPSSLDFDQRPSAARSGRAELEERYREHHETDPGLTGGDVDADWVSAYSVGDEAPGGDNPTPGQTVVEDVGRALGVEYGVEEELMTEEKIESRDRHRWELDPASAEDYQERTRGGRKGGKKK
jgi:hypothetical protein